MPRACAGLLYFAASVCLCAREPAGFLDAARRSGHDFTKSLPDYTCNETIHRFESPFAKNSWHETDTLVVQVTYSDGRDDYQFRSVNGAPADNDYPGVLGALSYGEFGGWLDAIFASSAAADFQWVGRDMMRGRAVGVYAFKVDRAHSQYELVYRDDRQRGATVPYHGLISVDLVTGRVTRITGEAEDIPRNFPLRRSSIELQYDFIDIVGRQYLLPLYAATHTATAKIEYRNEIAFDEYRKFDASTVIHFGDVAGRESGTPAPPPLATQPPAPVVLPQELLRFRDELRIYPPMFPPSPEEQGVILNEARQDAAHYASSLPAFICTDEFRIYSSPLMRESWKLRGAVVAELDHPNRFIENYGSVTIQKWPYDDVNGRDEFDRVFKAHTWQVIFKKMESDILDPPSRTQFQWERFAELRGRQTFLYSFTSPGTRGSVYIDRDWRRVTRIYAEADPPADYASALLDFALTDLPGGPQLLPLRAVVRERSQGPEMRYESEISKCAGPASARH